MPSQADLRYELYMDPEMDHDMEELAQLLGLGNDVCETRAEVFRRAMRLYVAVKHHQFDYNSRLIMEDERGNQTEIVGV